MPKIYGWLFVCCARANFSCVCVKLGCCTHDIEGALSSAARAPLCRLMAKLRNYFSKDANPIVIHLSGACVTAARPCPPRTRHHHCNCVPRFLAKAPLTSSPSTAREDMLSRCKSELFVCTLSWVVSRTCERTKSAHSRTVNVLLKRLLSIVLHKCQCLSRILSFRIVPCLKLAESVLRNRHRTRTIMRRMSPR